MNRLLCAWLLVATGLVGCSAEPGSVEIREPWILEAPAGAGMMAGYGVLENGTANTVLVRRVDSPAFKRVSIHETRSEGGQARMSPVDTLTLPGGGRAVMRPGGLHLMLVEPTTELTEGQSAEIRFHLDDGGQISARFPVRKSPPATH